MWWDFQSHLLECFASFIEKRKTSLRPTAAGFELPRRDLIARTHSTGSSTFFSTPL